MGINVSDVIKIILPNSIKEIVGMVNETGAFDTCKSLQEIDLNSVETIGTKAFARCTNLRSITIPESVTKMGEEVFYDCYSLERIYVPFTEGNQPEGWNWEWKQGCNAEVIYSDNEYLKFMQDYLENKSEEELEELILKSAMYIGGDFEQYLKEIGSSKEDIKEMANERYVTYKQFLKSWIDDSWTNSWLYVEFYVEKAGLVDKKIDELENLWAQSLGANDFNDYLSKAGINKDTFLQEILKHYRTEEDFLKVELVKDMIP